MSTTQKSLKSHPVKPLKIVPNNNPNKGAVHHRLAPVPGDSGHFHQVHMRDIRGRMFDFKQLRGKVVVVVNVASHDVKSANEYKDLQDLYEKYQSKGLEILAFPCNQFGGEEAGSNAEIAQFVETNFKATFKIMEKIDVNGEHTAPVYKMLKAAFPGMVKWNFNPKFLVDKRGRVLKRSRLLAHQLEDEIIDLLQEKI